MKRALVFVAVVIAVLAAGTPAYAQQDRKAAIVVTAPSGIGVLLPVNDQVAIRPEFFFSKTSTENASTALTTKFSSWQLGAGVSGLFYMGKPATFRTYWSPRFVVTHQDSTSTGTNSNGTNSYSASGSFGAQCALGDRFKVFGELGLNYGWLNVGVSTTLSTVTAKTRSFGTRSAVGVAFSF